MNSSNKKQSQGKVQFQRWNSRFSVGGANRTNIHQQIRRLSRENDVSPNRLPHYHQPTSSNRLPYDRYHYRASERQNSRGDEEQEYNLSNFRDSKGRPLQRVGLFRNAKHSDVILPNVDERVMRNAEAKIRRLTRRESGEEEDCRYDDDDRNPVRERVRQVVYEMNGNPAENFHQVPRRRAEVVARQLVYSPQPPRRYSNPRRNVLYDSGYEPRSPDNRRDNYYENDNEDYNRPSTSRPHQNDYYQHRAQDIRQEHRLASTSPPPPQTLSRSQKKSRKRQQNSPNTSIENRNHSYLSNHAQQSPELQELSDEDEKQKESENNDIQDKGNEIEEEDNDPDRPHSRLSDASTSSKKLNTSYSPEEDELTQWKKASEFFNTLDGEASAIIDRIGNSMPHLPLNDESEKCYSKIAFSLIFKSLQNQKNDNPPKKSTGDVFTNLVNMSTSWVLPSHQYSTILAGGGENFEDKKNETNDEEQPVNTVVFGDISKFQNPQNLLLDDSKFPTSSRFLEPTIRIASKNTRKRKTPLFQSSPVSNDVVRSSEISTMPSEIRNSQVIEKITEKEDEIESEEEEEREYDMDRYIDKGASQLTYIGTPEVQSTSKTTFRFINSDEIVRGTPEEKHNRSVQMIDDDQRNDSFRNDFEIQPSATSNQPFNFTFSNQKSINSTEMNVDTKTQQLFENAFEEYQNEKKKEENRKYQF